MGALCYHVFQAKMQPFPLSRSSLSQHNILGNHLCISRHATISTHTLIPLLVTQACAWQSPLCVLGVLTFILGLFLQVFEVLDLHTIPFSSWESWADNLT